METINVVSDENKRGTILLDAFQIINGERNDQYGRPEDSFDAIANFWSAYLQGKRHCECVLTARNVAEMMALMKVARMITGAGSLDSYIDCAGYIGLAADMYKEKK